MQKKLKKNFMKTRILFIIFAVCIFNLNAQYTIKGEFQYIKNQKLTLHGYTGFENIVIDQTTSNDKGEFTLKYGPKNIGMGYIITDNNKPYIFVLEENGIEFKGPTFDYTDSIVFIKGFENQQYIQYGIDFNKRENTLSVWDYLKKIYNIDSFFSKNTVQKEFIVNEIKRIKDEDKAYLASLNKNSYIYWFLPHRRLLSLLSIIAQYRVEEIPSALEEVRKIDYSDERLWKSGFIKESIENHYWFLENMGKSGDDMFAEMNKSSDYFIKSLAKDNIKLNILCRYLFKYFENHSLYKSADYLANKLLNDKTIKLNTDFAYLLEKHRKMKVGNVVSDFKFNGELYKDGKKLAKIKTLKDIKSDNIVLLFGSSQSPETQSYINKILSDYIAKWREKKVEIVFIAFDTDKKSFLNYSKTLPFINYSDYKGMEAPAIKEFCVHSFPSMIFIDKDKKIVLHPISIEHMNAWIEQKVQ